MSNERAGSVRGAQPASAFGGLWGGLLVGLLARWLQSRTIMGRESWRRVAIAGLTSMTSGMARARTLGLAAEVSFWLFLALVPLAAVAGLVAARVATSHTSMATSLVSAVAPASRALIAPEVERVASWRGGTVAPVAALTFVWLASSGVQSVLEALEVQSERSRPWWQRRLVAIGSCLVLSIGVAILSVLGAGLERIQALAGQTLPAKILLLEQGPLGQVLKSSLAATLAITMVAGLYRAGIPGGRRARIPVLPGAAFAVALQWTVCKAYGFYLARMGTGDAYLAGLSVVAVTMTTLWLLSVALLLGVQLNCFVGQCRRERQRLQTRSRRSCLST
jgi:membrane protein